MRVLRRSGLFPDDALIAENIRHDTILIQGEARSADYEIGLYSVAYAHIAAGRTVAELSRGAYSTHQGPFEILATIMGVVIRS